MRFFLIIMLAELHGYLGMELEGINLIGVIIAACLATSQDLFELRSRALK